jgi:hypothetical protein
VINNQGLFDFYLPMSEGENKTLPVRLKALEDYSGDFGLMTGELTFWAIKR